MSKSNQQNTTCVVTLFLQIYLINFVIYGIFRSNFLYSNYMFATVLCTIPMQTVARLPIV
jgi:hypothetical protein